MPRPEKVQAVADIKERFEEARAVFIAEYAGLSVKEQQELRRGLRASAGDFKIVKMTLARRAADDLGHEGLSEMLTGPTGLAFALQDAVSTAKALSDFAKEHQNLILKGAMLGGEVMPPEKIKELAELEPREVILAKIAGAFQAPMAAMAGLLAAMPRGLASMILQVIERGEAAEPPATAAPDGAEATATTEQDTPETEADDVPAQEVAVATDQTDDTPEPVASAETDDDDQAAEAVDTAERAEEE